MGASKFNETWIANRLSYRKGLTGSRLRLDPTTGMLEPLHRGFNVEKKLLFLSRFMVCSNQKQIADSVNVDVQSIYDAIALDPKFRKEYDLCNENMHRAKQFTDEMANTVRAETNQLINDLAAKMSLYKNASPLS